MSGAEQSNSTMPFLAVRNLHKRFKGVHALRGLTLALERGRIYHLLGENGCGKSTLIKIISGAQPPDEGEIVVDGVAHAALTPLQSIQAGIETVYQDLSLLPNLSVEENIGLTMQLAAGDGRLARRLDRKALAETAMRSLAVVGLQADAGFRGRVVADLPLAQRQLVAIARAIAHHAQLVIMDEPTTSLTQREVDNLVRVVRGLQAQGVCVLFVTHKLDECRAIGGDVILLRDGSLIAHGPIEQFTKAQIGALMTGRELSQERYRTARVAVDAPAVLEVDALRGDAFADVSFTLRAGEVLGVTGLMDSGRNELARALAGVVPATGGRIRLQGQDVRIGDPTAARDLRIGYVPEDRLGEGLFLDQSIADNAITAALPSLRGALGVIDRDRARRLAVDAVESLHVATPGVDVPVQSLSGGNQQRVLIGRWLAIEPRVLILHGPTVGVDVGSKDIIYRIVQGLAARGMGVLVISDDLPELLSNCDRVLLMRKGRLHDDFDAASIDEATLYRALIGEAHPAAAAGAGAMPAAVASGSANPAPSIDTRSPS